VPAPQRPDVTDDTKYGSRVLRLKPECKGFDVWELQIKLIGWGSGSDNDGIGTVMDPVRVTGTFDTTTRDAVMRLQKALKLPITGVVDDPTFRAIDKLAALRPVHVHDLRCPCDKRKDDPKIACRCEKHPEEGKCTGWGKARFKGKSLLEGKKLADDTEVSTDAAAELYDMTEHAGVDKALLWATRALMHRAEVDQIAVVGGYRCWHDNYLHTDERRWRHRRLTFHLGKAVEFYHAGRCADPGNAVEYRLADTGAWTSTGWDYDTAATCGDCDKIRKVALAKCGFQLRWQQLDRVSVAEGVKTAKPPASPVTVYLSTVRRQGRKDDDFVKTHYDAVQPTYAGTVSYSLPLDLGGGLDPRVAPAEAFFAKIEAAAAGGYPLGAARVWHGGVHLHASAGKEVYAMAGGEVVACRVGENVTAKAYGSRNFVLIKHALKDKAWYSLSMHLDAASAVADSPVGWRKQLFIRTKDHVEVLVATPVFELKDVSEKKADGTSVTKKRLVPKAGFAAGECVVVTGGEVDPTTLDDLAPKDSKVVKLPAPANTYVYTKLENKDVGTLHTPEGGLADKIAGGTVIALATPIKVAAGELIGYVAAAPTNDTLRGDGAFLHLETFAAESLVSGDGWVTVDASDPTKAADRKEVTKALRDAGLLPPVIDDVMLDGDLAGAGVLVEQAKLRSVVLKAPSAWSLDWKAALKDAPGMSFMTDTRRDELGDAFNEYRWWSDVSGGGKLPGSDVVHHVHPIAFILHLAHA